VKPVNSTNNVAARALVIQTSFLGDTVLTTPLLAYLAERAPVDVLVTPASAPLLANHPAASRVLVYDKRGREKGVFGFMRMAARLRRNRYAIAYHAQGSVRSSALSLAAGIPERVGFVTSAGRRFYTREIDYIENEHHASRLLRLAMDPGAAPTVDMLRPRLHPGDEERKAVDTVLRERGWKGEPFVALAPGSVWPTKRWPQYAALAELLDGRIAIVGASADSTLANEILRLVGAKAMDCTGRLSLLASAELIGRATVLVTNDSAPLHLASAMGTPTVALFGPTVPEFGFGPLAPVARVIGRTELACRPCDRHGPRSCPLGHWRCMREITPREVASVIQELGTSPQSPTSSR
jgi:heptosyltransferase-2